MWIYIKRKSVREEKMKVKYFLFFILFLVHEILRYKSEKCVQ